MDLTTFGRLQAPTSASLAKNEVPAQYQYVQLANLASTKARTVIEQYMANLPAAVESGVGPWFAGPVSVGKTTALGVLSYRLRNRLRYDVAWSVVGSDFTALERERFSAHTAERLRWLSTAPFAVFDGLNALRPKSWQYDTVLDVLSARLHATLPTFGTLDTTSAQALQEYPAALQTVIKRLSRGYRVYIGT